MASLGSALADSSFKDSLGTELTKQGVSAEVESVAPLNPAPPAPPSKDDDGVTIIIVGVAGGVVAVLLTAVTYVALKKTLLKRFGKKQVLPEGVKAAPQKGSGSDKAVPGPIES